MQFSKEERDKCLAPLEDGSPEGQPTSSERESQFGVGLRCTDAKIAVIDAIVKTNPLEPVPEYRHRTKNISIFDKRGFNSLLIYSSISHIIMLDVFRSLKTLLKTSRVQIDNNIFRLHYSITVILLLAFCVIITTKQYVGDPIDCVRSEAIPQSVINTYCWYL